MKRFSILDKLKMYSSDGVIYAYAALVGFIKGTLDCTYNPSEKITQIEGFIKDFEDFKKWREENKQ